MSEADFAVAIFPFLKTSGSIRIGKYLFRSTLDTEGLPTHQANAVNELAQMLFVQNDFRVKSASYAILPALEVHSGDPQLIHLAHLRDVVPIFTRLPTTFLRTSF